MKKLTAALALALSTGVALGQNVQQVPQNWHLLDQQTDGVYGISIEKAYQELLQNKQPDTVLVAVIDSGIDTLHEDLTPVLWRNRLEAAGGSLDPDRNGYAGDIYGWNFLGADDPSKNVTKDSYESERVYFKYKDKFAGVTSEKQVKKKDRELYKVWLKSKEHATKVSEAGKEVDMMYSLLEVLPRVDGFFKMLLRKDTYTAQDLDSLKIDDPRVAQGKKLYGMVFERVTPGATNKQLPELLQQYADSLKANLKAPETPPVDYRGLVVEDDYNNINDRYYGNNNLMAGNPKHGTHVAGIIGAARNNNLGIDGVADAVKIMMIRAVPDGDEHDKDIAMAIRYAVDNGAKIINMSFGKSFSPEREWVEDAIKYAEAHDVLIVRAAGNDNTNIDEVPYFPNPISLKDKTKAPNVITVGATGPMQRSLIAPFSNYGKGIVDVFAPGVNIYSTIPGGNAYGSSSGTSMASPVVTGLAAVIKAYYPHLSAIQIKNIIEASVTKIDEPVINPGTGEKVAISELARTGGIVNAYKALKLADTIQ
ncbi:subtilase family protein [Pontibacter ummariensis]|uniref:Subtilase family protein n=1 Tax=Pontibacter ummariensis TaxID=1610492 RepID=A0A239CJH4_9BACT|nr:S8 family serine peptidase [Pontibacter ummariensis]PRY14976.1 subtilase family protein [Pontibacter ummariensis]SNS20325.1 Subtilase family protein [Pontibacter ummariensis]